MPDRYKLPTFTQADTRKQAGTSTCIHRFLKAKHLLLTLQELVNKFDDIERAKADLEAQLAEGAIRLPAVITVVTPHLYQVDGDHAAFV